MAAAGRHPPARRARVAALGWALLWAPVLAFVEEGPASEDEDSRPGQPWRLEPDKAQIELHARATDECTPSSDRMENAVVIYLCTGPEDVDELLSHGMPRLYHFFLRRTSYPVVVFVPGETLKAYNSTSFARAPDAEGLRKAAMLGAGMPPNYDLRVVEFDLKYPAVIEAMGDWRAHANQCGRKFDSSYKHMNQFFTKVMYEQEVLAPYRYYMRVDTDITLTAPVPTDPFCMARVQQKRFLWQTRKKIAWYSCSEGMGAWMRDYAASHDLTPKDTLIWGSEASSTNYVGYIGVGDFEFFRDSRVRELSAAFNADGRIYLNRWSDQTYYVFALSLFEPHDAVGDIGLAWPPAVWCHKCTTARHMELQQETCSPAFDNRCYTESTDQEVEF